MTTKEECVHGYWTMDDGVTTCHDCGEVLVGRLACTECYGLGVVKGESVCSLCGGEQREGSR